jgi:hypothetical protein
VANITCKYISKLANDSTDWVAAQVFSGRSVLHSVISFGQNQPSGSSSYNPGGAIVNSDEYIRRLVIFYDSASDSDFTKEKYRFINTLGGNGYEDSSANDKSWGQHVVVNVPGNGMLFENGIVIKMHQTCLGVSVFASGGAV